MATRNRFSRDDQRSAFSGNVRLWEKKPVNLAKVPDMEIVVDTWVPTGEVCWALKDCPCGCRNVALDPQTLLPIAP